MKLSDLPLCISSSLPLLLAMAGRVDAQCVNGSCPPDSTLDATDPVQDEIVGVVPFRKMTLTIGQFDRTIYALEHDVPPESISLLGVSVEFYGETNPLIQLDSASSPQSCSANWSYDVDSVIYTNPAIGNPGALVVVSESGITPLPAGNGAPPPWDVTITPPKQSDSFCFFDTEDLDAWAGTGEVEFTTDGYSFSMATGCAQILSSFTNQGLLRVTVTYHYCIADEPPPPDDPGVAYCFCDGSGTAPPCSNPGGADEGCRNSSGSGSKLSADGSDSVGADDLVFTADSLLDNQPVLLFAALNKVNNGNGNIFGDGIRCAGGDVVRIGFAADPGPTGTVNFGPDLANEGGWTAGDTRRFQAWYRDPADSAPCTAAFNLSNGYEVTFTP